MTEVYTGLEDSRQISYEVYAKWLANNTEKYIGANYLTNPQIFWIASAFSSFNKYHRTVPKKRDEARRLTNEYLHVYFKNKPGFQEAFMCNMTEAELEEFEEYARKRVEIYLRTKT